MTRPIRFSFLLALLAAASITVEAQTMSFFRDFTTPQIDSAAVVAADGSGVYVVGTRVPSGGGDPTAGIRKYDATGMELWTRQFSAPSPKGLRLLRAAADGTGLYVLAGSGEFGAFFLRRYSPAGDELWTRELGFSFPGDMAADGAGVYIAGRDFPPDRSYVRKYSRDGTELWTTAFADHALENPHAIAVDAMAVYVFGVASQILNPGASPLFVRKFDASSGSNLWRRSTDQPVIIPLGAAGVGGAAGATSGFYLISGGPGVTLNRYDAEAKKLWTRAIPFPSGIAVDATGIFISGTSASALPGQCRSGAGFDSFVRRYDSDGAEGWTRQFGTSQATLSSGIALDSTSVYIVGRDGPVPLDDGSPFPPGFNSSAFLAKFDKAAAPPPKLGPRIFPGCIVNAATYVGGGVAPGEMVTLFGSSIGPAALTPLSLTAGQRLSTSLAGTRILFDEIPAPLLYVSDRQSAAIVPYAVAGKVSVEVVVEYSGVRSEAVTVPALKSRPGVFSIDGSGLRQGAILNEDGSFNSPSNPAARGSIITIFGTGGGEAAPGIMDGQIVGGVLPRTSLPVAVFFDLGLGDFGIPAKQAEVLYAGGVPGSVAGLLQLNVRVPVSTTSTGDKVPFALVIGSEWTMDQATVALR